MRVDREKQARIRRWRQRTFRVLKQIDPRWNPASVTFSAAMVLAASYIHGSNVDVLREMTGLPEGFIRRVMTRLRKSKVWRGERMRVSLWDDPDGFKAQVAFICDVLVAAGGVVRMGDPKVTEARKVKREQQRKDGKCTACGRAWAGHQRTCQACRDAVRRSRRGTTVHVGAFTPQIAKADPWYKADGDEDRL